MEIFFIILIYISNLKHKVNAEVHKVAIEWGTRTFHNIKICESSAGYPRPIAQNLNGIVVQLLCFGGEWEPVVAAC